MPVVLGLLFAVLLGACEDAAEKKFGDYIHGSYYTTLAKARGDLVREFGTIVQTVDANDLPRTDAKRLEMVGFLERWVRTTSDFRSKTANDDADARLKPLRDKYIEADNLFTYAFTEFFSAVDPKAPTASRRAHLSEMASGYTNANKALGEAYALAEKLMHR